MASIPVVPGSEIDIQTPNKAVPLNPNVAGLRMRGQEAIAGAIEGVGDRFGAVADDLMRARNAGIAADVDLKMRVARQQFLESIKNTSDERDWGNQASQVADKVRSDIFSTHEGISPGMEKQIESGFRAWSSNLMVETQAMANQQTISRAWSQTQTDLAESLKDGDASHAMNLLQNARNNRLTYTTTIDQMERGIPKEIASNMIEQGFQNNPKGTVDLLKSGGSLPAVDQNGNRIVPSKVFSQKELERYIVAGTARTQAWQKANMETLLQTATDKETGFVDDDIVEEAMKKGTIEEKTGRAFIDSQDRRVKAVTNEEKKDLAEENRTKATVLNAKIHDPIDWESDPEGHAHDLMKEAMGISDRGRQATAVSDIDRQLTAVLKNGRTTDSPTVRQQILVMKDDMSAGNVFPVVVPGKAAEKGMIFDTDAVPAAPYPGGVKAVEKLYNQDEDHSSFHEKFGKDATLEDVIEPARHSYFEKVNQLVAWSHTKEGQNATPEQVEEKRKQIEFPDALHKTKAALNPDPAEGTLKWAEAHATDPRGQSMLATAASFKAKEDVAAAYKSGKLSYDEAADILREQFGGK